VPFRYVPVTGSVLIVPLMVTVGRGAVRSMSIQRSAKISPIRAPVASIKPMMSAMSVVAFGPERCLVVHARAASRTVFKSSRVSDLVSVFSQ
jgi:hypothetical protein